MTPARHRSLASSDAVEPAKDQTLVVEPRIDSGSSPIEDVSSPSPQTSTSTPSHLEPTSDDRQQQSVAHQDQSQVADGLSDSLPSDKLPLLPPRSYESYQDLIFSNRSSSRLDSNRILLNFLFSLSNLVLFGGSLAGMIVLLYQRYLFPRLEIRNNVLAALKTSALKSYTAFLERISALSRSNPSLYRAASRCGIVAVKKPAPEIAQGLQTDSAQDYGSDGPAATNSLPQSDPLETNNSSPAPELAIAPDELCADSQPSAEDNLARPPIEDCPSSLYNINQPIHDSLNRISTTLRRRQKPMPLFADNANNKRESSPVHNLFKAVERFRLELYSKNSAYLNSFSQTGLKSYHSQFPRPKEWFVVDPPDCLSPSATNDDERSKKVIEQNKKALGDFKAEIRILKGMLLTRRNFADWRATSSVS